MLNIKNLKAIVDNKHILNGLNLDIKPGQVHAIMGPILVNYQLKKELKKEYS